MRMPFSVTSALLTALSAALALGSPAQARPSRDHTAPAAGPTAGVSIEKPWMRFVIKSVPAAGYFTLKNDSGSAVQLTAAASSACGMVMLHQSKEVNGVEEMLPVTSVTVGAHSTLSFTPGGYHLMCMSPGSAMKVGASVPVTLKFGNGQSLTAQFPVKGANAQ